MRLESAREKRRIEPRPIGRHAVVRLDRANRDHAFVAAPVAHHAHRLERQQHREGLPQARAEPGRGDLFHHDRVGAAQQLEPLARDLADDPHRQPGSGKRLAIDDLGGQAELAADLAHLVLEQLAQRLDQLQAHPLRQSADIVMALDRRPTAP